MIQYWKDLSILEGGLEVAGHGKNVQLQVEVAPLDTTPLSTQGWTEMIGGLKTSTLELGLMQDLDEGSIDDTLWSNFGAASTVRSLVTASADGSVAYLMRGLALNHTPVAGNVGELAMTTPRVAGSGVAVRGRLLHPSNVNRTSSAAGAGRQLGAVVAGKRLYAALHVLSSSGTSPTLDVKIQSDDNSDFTSATDRITFSQASGKTSEWSSVDGAITDDYWRISYTIGGSATPTFAFAVTAGIL